MDCVKGFDLNVEYHAEEGDCNVNYALLNGDEDTILSDFLDEIALDNKDVDEDVEVEEDVELEENMEEIRNIEANIEDDIDVDDTDIVTEPSVGLVFESAKTFLRFCHEYGEANGFQFRVRSSEKKKQSTTEIKSIERNRHIKDYSDCVRLRLVCSKQGTCDSVSKHPARPVSSIRSGCNFKVNASACDDGTSWRITHVVLQHNHECKKENKMFMPSYRHISAGNRRILLDHDRAGISVAKNYTTFVVRYGGHNEVPFDERDCRNAITIDRRSLLEEGDFEAMRKYFEKMVDSGSNFFYAYDTYDDGVLKNVFWADGRSRGAYEDFGDLVSFDTTYVKNRYRMPFAPIIGVNNHGQSILFGCALLGGEEAENFVWLFRTWLTCMNNKAPKGIITDQCKAMENAIGQVFPEAIHRWCIWHVMRNANKNLDKREGVWRYITQGLHKVLYESLTIPKFEEAWYDWIEKFGLQNNSWCSTMFDKRKKWVPVYFKSNFWAGMSSTQRSESMNFFFKGYVNVNTSLKQFVEQYGLALAKRVKIEDKATFNSINSPIQCATEHEFEYVFQRLYTSSKFVEFQKEVKLMTYSNATKIQEVGGSCLYEILVRRHIDGVIRRRSYMVTMDRDSLVIICDCKGFEFRGILCSHILCVLHAEEVSIVPKRYILDRWRKDLPRVYMKIPVPYYSLLEKRPKAMERYESMKSGFEGLATEAMIEENLYSIVMSGIAELKLKVKGVAEGHGVPMQTYANIGRVYGRRLATSNKEVTRTEKDVIDPPDKRGRGRAAGRRKGYHNEKHRNTKAKSTRVQNDASVVPMSQDTRLTSRVPPSNMAYPPNRVQLDFPYNRF